MMSEHEWGLTRRLPTGDLGWVAPFPRLWTSVATADDEAVSWRGGALGAAVSASSGLTSGGIGQNREVLRWGNAQAAVFATPEPGPAAEPPPTYEDACSDWGPPVRLDTVSDDSESQPLGE